MCYDFNSAYSEDSRFGFRCLCVGYEDSPFTSQRQGLVALEMELIYAGAACASRLLAPDLDIPPLTFCKFINMIYYFVLIHCVRILNSIKIVYV